MESTEEIESGLEMDYNSRECARETRALEGRVRQCGEIDAGFVYKPDC